MPNIILNNKNLGPIIDVTALPTENINPNAIYRLIISKFDMVNGHGKDNESYPVGYYKPATGTKWTATQVTNGSSGVYMDGYSASPCTKMRKGTFDSWNPVPCTAAESSGIWYYDYERDNVYFAWNPVDYGGVNYYSPEKLNQTLGYKYGGCYTYLSGKWEPIDDREECTFLGTGYNTTLSNVKCVKIGENTYHVTAEVKTNTTMNANTPYRFITNFKIGPVAKAVPFIETGYGYTNNSGLIATFLIHVNGDCWITFSSNCASGTYLYIGATVIVA